MKDYMDAVKAAGIGRTPQLCQDALIEMLEELFAGKKYNGQQGRKPLNIYKQDLPVPEDYDADVDTDAAAAPYIVARMTGGAIKDESGPQTVEFSLIVCAYDEGGAREGYQDVANIKEDIVQHADLQNLYPGTGLAYIERLSQYMASTGKSYRSHYATIKSWIAQDFQKKPASKYDYDYTYEEGECL